MVVTLKISDDESGVLNEKNPTSSGGYGEIGGLEFVSPSGNQIVEASIFNNQRINGDKYSGTYQVQLN